MGGSGGETSTSQASLLQPGISPDIRTYLLLLIQCQVTGAAVWARTPPQTLPPENTSPLLQGSVEACFMLLHWCKVIHLFYKGERGSSIPVEIQLGYDSLQGKTGSPGAFWEVKPRCLHHCGMTTHKQKRYTLVMESAMVNGAKINGTPMDGAIKYISLSPSTIASKTSKYLLKLTIWNHPFCPLLKTIGNIFTN